MRAQLLEAVFTVVTGASGSMVANQDMSLDLSPSQLSKVHEHVCALRDTVVGRSLEDTQRATRLTQQAVVVSTRNGSLVPASSLT